MNHYSHFTLKERELLMHYMDIGFNQSEIAKNWGATNHRFIANQRETP